MIIMEPYVFKQLYVSFLTYIGQSLVGFGLGWSAPIIPKLLNPEQTPLPRPVDETQVFWIGSVLYIGTITGPFISGYLSNTRGRKPCFFLGGVMTFLAFLLLAVSRNLAMIFAGRILTGLGTSIIFVINIVYIGEIASTNIRGILLTGTGIFSTFGTLLVYAIGPYVPYYSVSVVGIFLTLGYLVGLFYIPESPTFFVTINRNESAIKSLVTLGRSDEINEYITSKSTEEKKGKWKDLFLIKSNRQALLITYALNLFQQASGIIVVLFYAMYIFSMASSSIDPNIATIIIGITQLLSSFISPVFVDWKGRKLLLLVSTACCCVSLGLLGLYFLFDENSNPIADSLRWMPLTTVILFFISYDMGFGIIPGTLIGEMFQSNLRSIAAAITITSGWVFGFALSSSFIYLVSSIGSYFTFWIFSGACALAFIFTLFVVPETKGKTFAEIQQLLS